MLAELGRAYRRADAEAALLRRDLVHGLDAFHIDDEVRLYEARTQTDEEVGAAGEQIGLPALCGKEAYRRFDSRWSFITHGIPVEFPA